MRAPALSLSTLLATLAALTSVGARAQDTPFCVDRPGANTPPCTLEAGQVMAEMSLADWTLERSGDQRTDTVLAGDLLVRVGLGEATEARVGLTPYGHYRTRTRATGAIDAGAAVGNLYLGVRHGFSGSDGPVAVQLFVTVPTGRTPIGAGTWTAGALLPLQFSLSDAVSFAATPEVDALADASDRGHHLAFGSAAGVSVGLADDLSNRNRDNHHARRGPGRSGHHCIVQPVSRLAGGQSPAVRRAGPARPQPGHARISS